MLPNCFSACVCFGVIMLAVLSPRCAYDRVSNETKTTLSGGVFIDSRSSI